MQKQCSFHLHFGETMLPQTEFYKDKSQTDGLFTICKTCTKRSQALSYKKHREKRRLLARKKQLEGKAQRPRVQPKYISQKQRTQNQFAADPVTYCRKRMLYRARSRARVEGIQFNLTLDDIQIPERCPMLGLELHIARQRANDNTPSLDRITPALGYVKDNVLVISQRANMIKNNGTAEEHLKIYEFLSRRTLP